MAIKMIVEASAGLLVEIRQLVDGPNLDEAKLAREASRYVSGADGKRAFVFEKDGQILGYVLVILGATDFPKGAPHIESLKGFGHISKIGVAKSARGKGVGSELLLVAERWLQSGGAKGTWLDYLPSNESAVRLYSKNGYSDVAEFQDVRNRTRRITSKTW